jgi:segregation and condensation protein B
MLSEEESGIASAIESILLVASEPISTRSLSRVLDVDAKLINRALDRLEADQSSRGIRVQVDHGTVQLVTAPENAEVVHRFLQLPRQPKLSRASVETLAIIAYEQPITRGEIEHIRGVNVDRMISNLEARGWIDERGRRDSPGRPIEYGTTSAFLELFGLLSLTELPAPRSSSLQQSDSSALLGLEADAPASGPTVSAHDENSYSEFATTSSSYSVSDAPGAGEPTTAMAKVRS